jgi:hypothetical protein
MTITQGRNTLFAIFLAGLTTQVVAVILPYRADTIRDREMLAVLTKLILVYSVHFRVMLGGVFGRQQNTRGHVAAPAFVVAVTVTLVWNLLLAWRSIAFAGGAFNPLSEDSPDNLIAYLDSIADQCSFLVVGPLAFFSLKNSGQRRLHGPCAAGRKISPRRRTGRSPDELHVDVPARSCSRFGIRHGRAGASGLAFLREPACPATECLLE